MSNKYCNLPGGEKISETFGQINDGFASVETDKDELQSQINNHIDSNSAHNAENITFESERPTLIDIDDTKEAIEKIDQRVDELVNNPDPNKDLELVDLRNSNIYGVFPTAKARSDYTDNLFSSQLADIVQQTDDLEINKTDKTYTDTELAKKRNILAKLELEDLSSNVLGAIAGNTTFNVLSEPQENSVTRDKYDKAVRSVNLFDKTKLTLNKYIDTSGALIESTFRHTTDYILVEPNTVYTIGSVRDYAFYDTNKTFISCTPSADVLLNHQITTPANAKYLRYTISTTISNVDTEMVVKGNTMPTAYVPFTFKLTDLMIGEENLDEGMKTHVESIGKLEENLVYTKNLFNKNKITTGKYPSHSTGALLDSASRNTSDYIPVTPTTTYTIKSSSRNIVFFDANKIYISGIDLTGIASDNYQFTVPVNAKYFRFDYYTSYISDGNQIMVVKGTEMPTSYLPYGYEQPYLLVNDDNFDVDLLASIQNDLEGRINITGYYWSDICFVGEELWAFEPSDVDGVNTTDGYIYMFDSTLTFKRQLKHNFGHVNTVEYCEEIDSLILGNGSGYYGTDGEIYIIQGVSQWRGLPDNTLLDLVGGISGSLITTIQVGRTFGDKVNVCWGEDNNGLNNICYAISNNNQNVRKLLLGKGTNQFESGQFVSGRTDTQFNGTYKILGEWTHPVIEVNQGSCYYNGYLWLAIGHDGLFIAKFKLNPDGTITSTPKQEFFYEATGTLIETASEGVTIKNGMIYHAVKGGINAVYKYRPF